MKNVRVLVYPCGSEIGLEIFRSLKSIPFVTLVGASSAPCPGEFCYEHYVGDAPWMDAGDFGGAMARICFMQEIDLIMPANDEAALCLLDCADELPAPVVSSSLEVARICRDKRLTYEALTGCDFLPRIYATADAVDDGDFPVVIKPAVGQGAEGFQVLRDRATLERKLAAAARDERPQVICQYLPGEEVTVDCFSDARGLRYAESRRRLRIKNGIAVRSVSLPDDQEARAIAAAIQDRLGPLGLHGVWFFQLRRDEAGRYRLLEVATRTAGTMCVDRAAGVNLPLMAIWDALGYQTEPARQFADVEVSRALANSYRLPLEFDELFIDFDDTIVDHRRSTVNLEAIRLLYQCANRRIPVTLVTRYPGGMDDLLAALAAFRLDPALFRALAQVPAGQSKADAIAPGPRAIYVDDSFGERNAVVTAHGIPALGVDALEALLDGRA
ncbi:MAG: ATP-grasp domain-containing protein [Actinomycetia bacterium]|nr:ATP-grasp domain-containing protein [Actinomycetes bacterium]